MNLRSTFGGLPALYWTLWLGTLVNRIGGFVVPFLGLYLTRARGLPVAEAGVIVALFGAGSVTAAFLGGLLTDRLGRRATLLLALVGGGLAMLALGFARAAPTIAALTFTLGLVSDLARPATAALIADVVPPENRLRAYALQHWAINIGFSVAPLLAGVLADLSYFVLFVGDACTTLLYALLVYLRVPEPPHSGAREPVWRGLRTVASDGPFLAFTGLTFLTGMIYKQVDVALAVDVTRHGISPAGYGIIVAVNGALIVVLSPLLAPKLNALPRGRLLAAAAFLTGAGFASHALAESALAFAAGVAVWTLGEIASSPASSAIVAERAPAALRGRYQGAFMMSWGLAAFAGPAIGSQIIGRWGVDTLWAACGVLGTLTAAAFLVIVRRLE